MPNRQTRYCHTCGGRLARDNSSSHCGPCSKYAAATMIVSPEVPPEFWDADPLRAALASWHIGRVIRAYRYHPWHGPRPLSQELVGGWLGLTQAQLSRVEGGSAVTDLSKLVPWARTLKIPGQRLWFKLPDEPSETETEDALAAAQPSEAGDQTRMPQPVPRAPSGILLPVVISGRPVLVPLDADTMAASGLGILDELTVTGTPGGFAGTTGEPGAEHVFRAPEFAKIDDMNRRELLRVMSMAGTLLAMGAVQDDVDWERLDYFANPAHKLDGQAVEEFAALNAHLWRVFVLSRTKHVVFPLVRAQLDVLINSLERAAGPAIYRRLCELASSLFQLSGEIFFDGNQYTDAAHCYTLAATASREANTPDLWACALTRHAFIEVYERQFEKSAAMLDLAASLAQRGDGTLATRYWVAVVQAQTFAGLGDVDACQRALDVAEQVHNLRGEIQNGGWLRFDGSRLAEERGTCYIQLQRPDLAEPALADAVGQNLSVRRRGSVLTDLAVLGAQRRDLDQMITYANAAVEMVLQTGSGVIVCKLKGLQLHLPPFLKDVRVRDLNRRIATMAGNMTAR